MRKNICQVKITLLSEIVSLKRDETFSFIKKAADKL